MPTRHAGWLVVVMAALQVGYVSSYFVMRLGHTLVHQALFVSEEGYNARWWHSVDASADWARPLETVYAPLIVGEVGGAGGEGL